MQSARHVSRNAIIQSAAYDTVYHTMVIPDPGLKDMQQDIDNLQKIKITKQMNPLKTKMKPDRSSRIYVFREACAHARLVKREHKKGGS